MRSRPTSPGSKLAILSSTCAISLNGGYSSHLLNLWPVLSSLGPVWFDFLKKKKKKRYYCCKFGFFMYYKHGEETKLRVWDFPGGPVVKIPHFHYRGHRFEPWSGKFHMPCGEAEKKKKRITKIIILILKESWEKYRCVMFLVIGVPRKCPCQISTK